MLYFLLYFSPETEYQCLCKSTENPRLHLLIISVHFLATKRVWPWCCWKFDLFLGLPSCFCCLSFMTHELAFWNTVAGKLLYFLASRTFISSAVFMLSQLMFHSWTHTEDLKLPKPCHSSASTNNWRFASFSFRSKCYCSWIKHSYTPSLFKLAFHFSSQIIPTCTVTTERLNSLSIPTLIKERVHSLIFLCLILFSIF